MTTSELLTGLKSALRAAWTDGNKCSHKVKPAYVDDYVDTHAAVLSEWLNKRAAADSDGKAEPIGWISSNWPDATGVVRVCSVIYREKQCDDDLPVFLHPPAEAWAEVRAVAGELEEWADDSPINGPDLAALAARLRKAGGGE